MPTDAQRRATANYRKRNVKQIVVSFYPADAELLAWIKTQPNQSGYLKDLARADMEAKRNQPSLT